MGEEDNDDDDGQGDVEDGGGCGHKTVRFMMIAKMMASLNSYLVIHMMMMMTLSTRRQLGDTGEDLGFQRVLRLS